MDSTTPTYDAPYKVLMGINNIRFFALIDVLKTFCFYKQGDMPRKVFVNTANYYMERALHRLNELEPIVKQNTTLPLNEVEVMFDNARRLVAEKRNELISHGCNNLPLLPN